MVPSSSAAERILISAIHVVGCPPFVHAFNPAIASPWQIRSDFDASHALAGAFLQLAATYLGKRLSWRHVVALPVRIAWLMWRLTRIKDDHLARVPQLCGRPGIQAGFERSGVPASYI